MVVERSSAVVQWKIKEYALSAGRNTTEKNIPNTEVKKAVPIPDSSELILSRILSDEEESKCRTEKDRPMNVPRIPRLVRILGVD